MQFIPARLCIFLSLLLCGSFAVGQNPAVVHWTGEGGDGLWSSPLNWTDAAGVKRLPGSGDTVVFGHADHQVADTPQSIDLDVAGVTVRALVFAGTGDRVILLHSAADHVLNLADTADTISMADTADADATVNLRVHMTGSVAGQFNNYSMSATLILGPQGYFTNSTGTHNSFGGGTIRIQGSSGGSLGGQDGSVIMDTSGGWRHYFGHGENDRLYLTHDLTLARGLNPYETSTLALIESGTQDRVLDVRYTIGWSGHGTLVVGESPDDSSGRLTLRTRSTNGETLGRTLSADNKRTSIILRDGDTLELYERPHALLWAENPALSGGGNLWVTTPEVVDLYRALEHTGRTMLENGVLRFNIYIQNAGGAGTITHYGSLPRQTIVEIGENATLDLNGVPTQVGGLTDYPGRNMDQAPTAGNVLLNGGALTVNSIQNSTFSGHFSGPGSLIKMGAEKFTLTGAYTTGPDGVLQIGDGHMEIGDTLDISDGSLHMAGGRLSVNGLEADSGSALKYTLTHVAEGEPALVVCSGHANLAGVTLEIRAAEDFAAEYNTQIILLQADSMSGISGNGGIFGYSDGDVIDTDGFRFAINYDSSNERITLTLLPSPFIWSSGAFVNALPAEEPLRDIRTADGFRVIYERDYTRPGERFLELLLEVDQAQPLNALHWIVQLFAANGTLLEQSAVPVEAARMLLQTQLHGQTDNNLDIRIELHGANGLIGSDTFAATAQAVDNPIQPGRRIEVSLDWPEHLSHATPRPVTFGVPFPAGVLWDPHAVRLTDAAGIELPAQTEVTAHWAPQGAIRWLRLDTVATPQDGLYLEFTPSAKPQVKDEVEVIDHGQQVTVRVAGAEYLLAPGHSPVKALSLDGIPIAHADGGRGLYVIDQLGRMASAAADNSMLIEASGPITASIRFEGFYRTAEGEALARHITRVEFFAGQQAAAITHTLVLIHDTNELWFNEVGWEWTAAPGDPVDAIFSLAPNSEDTLSVALPEADDFASLWQMDYLQFGGGRKLFQVLAPHANGSGSALYEGEEMGDWGALLGSQGGLLISCRDSARQHPTEIKLQRDRATLKLFSNRGGASLDFRPPALLERWNRGARIPADIQQTILESTSDAAGWSKTHELLLAPLPPAAPVTAMAALSNTHSNAPHALIDPWWIYESRVLGPLYPKDEAMHPGVERFIEQAMENFYPRGHERDQEYGFIDYFAGPHYTGFNSHRYRTVYSVRMAPWLLYARSGDRHLREFAEGTNRTYGDNYIAHWPTPHSAQGLYLRADGFPYDYYPYYWARHGQSYQGGGPNSINQFLWDYYLTGYRRAGDISRAFAAAVGDNLSTYYRLKTLRNLWLAYSIDWNPQLREPIEHIMNWVYDPDSPIGILPTATPQPSPLYKTPEDTLGIVEAWELFGDRRYLDMATKLSAVNWDMHHGGNPLETRYDKGRTGEFLYRVTGDPDIPLEMARAIRQGVFGPTSSGVSDMNFRLIGLPYALSLVAETDPQTAADIQKIGQPIYWTGDGDGSSWNDPANWYPTKIPDTDDLVRLGHPEFTPDQPIHIVVPQAGGTAFGMSLHAAGNRNIHLSGGPLSVLAEGMAHMPKHATADATLDVELISPQAIPIIRNDSLTANLILGPDSHFSASSGRHDKKGRGTLRVAGSSNGSLSPEAGVTILDLGGGKGWQNIHSSDGTRLHLASDSFFSRRLYAGGGSTWIAAVESPPHAERALAFGYGVHGPALSRLVMDDSPDGSQSTLRLRLGSISGQCLSETQIVTRPGDTVEIYRNVVQEIAWAANPGIVGGGDLWVSSNNQLTLRRKLDYTGHTILQRGLLQLAEHIENPGTAFESTHYGSLPRHSIVEIGAAAILDLNGIDQTLAGLKPHAGGHGTLQLGGATLSINSETASAFGGTFEGPGQLLKLGPDSFTLEGSFTAPPGLQIRADQGLLTIADTLDLNGNTITVKGGQIAATRLLAVDSQINLTLQQDSDKDTPLLEAHATDIADISNSVLNLQLSEDFQAFIDDTFMLVKAGTITGAFANYSHGQIWEADGYRFRMDQTATEVILTVEASPLGEPFEVSASAHPADKGVIHGSGNHRLGEVANLSAHATDFYTFSHWGGDLPQHAINDNPLLLVVQGDHTLVAYFQPIKTQQTATPYWWLAKYGFDAQSFESDSLIDHSGNRLPAWKEYILDLDPLDPTAEMPKIVIQPQHESYLLTIDKTSSNRLYAIERAETLGYGNWSTLTQMAGTGERQNFVFERGQNGQKNYFLRLRVSVPEPGD